MRDCFLERSSSSVPPSLKRAGLFLERAERSRSLSTVKIVWWTTIGLLSLRARGAGELAVREADIWVPKGGFWVVPQHHLV